MVIGCAMYVDILKAPSLLSLSLQNEVVDIIDGIRVILKAVTTLRSMVKQSGQLSRWYFYVSQMIEM